MNAARSSFHHGSHRGLLSQVKDALGKAVRVDAIIVPNARPSWYLRESVRLAGELGCPLVVLCSKNASAKAVAWLARLADIELIAIDSEEIPADLLPNFHTSDLLRHTRFHRSSDTSLKRNLGLLLARVAGWERVVFLDDDISVPVARDLQVAAGLLDEHAGVGLSIGGYPDNSVVCHANRESGGYQDTFIGGGALAVRMDLDTSFFPNIYNEDWFFLLSDNKLRPSALTGMAIQQPYDPFCNPQRAINEELGDCLAEGVYWLLDQGRRVRDANGAYWELYLQYRLHFIEEVMDRVRSAEVEGPDRRRMMAALTAARGRCRRITPKLCVDYLRLWRADRGRWQRHLAGLPTDVGSPLGTAKALAELGLLRCAIHQLPKRGSRAGITGRAS